MPVATPSPILNTLNKAKHPYRRPIGYATRSRWSDMRRTATNMPDAEYVHHKMDNMERRYPILPLTVESGKLLEVQWKRYTHSSCTTTLTAHTPTIGNKQYPNTEAVRYASIPLSDIRFNNVNIDAEPSKATP